MQACAARFGGQPVGRREVGLHIWIISAAKHCRLVPAPGLLRASCPTSLRGRTRCGSTLGCDRGGANGYRRQACSHNCDLGERCGFDQDNRRAPFTNWCRHQDSNPGPTDYKSVALPTELYRHGAVGYGVYSKPRVAPREQARRVGLNRPACPGRPASGRIHARCPAPRAGHQRRRRSRPAWHRRSPHRSRSQ